MESLKTHTEKLYNIKNKTLLLGLNARKCTPNKKKLVLKMLTWKLSLAFYTKLFWK
jgi:hypothetical protein